MIKRFYLIGFLTIVGISTILGEPVLTTTDSLVKQLANADNKHKLLLYNKIAQSYLPGDPENCIKFAGKALKYANGQKNAEQKGYAFNNLGSAYYNLYQFDEALKNYFNARDIFLSLGDKSQSASVLINIGLVYRERNNYDEARQVLLNSLGIYQSLHDKSGMANAQNMLGSLARQEGNMKDALQFYKDALKTRLSVNKPDDIAASLNNIALIYKETGQTDTAVACYLKALDIRNHQNNKPQIANILNEIGNAYWDHRDFEKALEYYFRSIKIRYEIGDNNEIANSYQNIGNLYSKLGDTGKAREYYLQALKLYMVGEDKKKLASLLTLLGNLEFSANNYQDAFDYFSRALGYRKEIGEKNDIAASLNSMANVYSQLHKDDEAEKYFNMAFSLRKELRDTAGQITTINDLGNLYEKRGMSAKAESCFELAYKLANATGNIYYIGLCARKIAEYDIEQNHPEKATALIAISHAAGIKLKNAELHKFAHFALYEQYKKLNNYRDALTNFQIYARINDSIQAAQNSLKMLTIQQNLELEKKNNDLKSVENEVSTLRHEKELQSLAYLKQRYILIFLVIMVVLLLTIGLLLNNRYQVRKKHNRELQLQYAELEEKNALLIKSESELSKLNALKDRFFAIIAHDIRNPLSALLGLSHLIQVKSDTLKDAEIKEFNSHIYKSATNLNNLLENLLNWARSNTNKLRFNPANIKLYPVIESIISLNELGASQKNIQLECKVDENIEVTADPQMLNLILRNLISNAVKFTSPGGKVTIKAIEVLTHVEVSITDTGVGISHEDQGKLFGIASNFTTYGTNREPGTGLGLVLVKEFVEKNNGRVYVNSILGKGSTFTFTLPI